MSSIIRSDLDLTALPTALLPLVKSHLRVDGTYDDAYITDTIKRAINWFERVTQVSVNPVTWTWRPGLGHGYGDFCGGIASVPISPVNTFTVAGGDASDITSGYELTTTSTHGVGLYALAGTFASGMQVSMPSGYEDADAIDPGITDIVLRYTAHLYENREILVPGIEAQTPGWMTDVIATYWVPRC
jgi:uncharacterized phiE125 gp8 family phage protein